MALLFPPVIGHRGACGYAPENTLASIQAAADCGATWVELDVKLTQDNIPIIFHDDTLERTTNGYGKVADIDYDALSTLDSGAWYDERFVNTPIPTLTAAVQLIETLGLGLNLEIKPCKGREEATTKIALEHLATCWKQPNKLLISSFQPLCLATSLHVAPDLPRGALFETIPNDIAHYVNTYDTSTIHVAANSLTADKTTQLKTFDKPILAYTVNDANTAQTLYGWGVDAVFSDVPDMIPTQ